MTQLDQICFACLRLKVPHEEHCNICNQCVSSFQCHSAFFDRCVGLSNQRSYFVVVMTTFLLLCSYLTQLLFFSVRTSGWQHATASNWLFRLLELHLSSIHQLNWQLLLPLLLAWLSFFTLLDTVLTLLLSVTKGITLHEFLHGWDYKHNLRAMKPPIRHQRRCRDSHCLEDHGGAGESKKAMKYS